MDRSYEPPEPFQEFKITTRLTDQVATPRMWHLPVALRVRHSGLREVGISSPPPRGPKPECFTLPLRGYPSILSYPGSKHWLVTTVTLPDGSTPEDPFAQEPPHTRVDGVDCRGTMTLSSAGKAYMAYVDISRASLGSMTARVLESEPDSRILVRLLPRYATGALRYWPGHRAIQFWTAI